ncbi:hypothetical protein BDN67DRAFT_976397 [Paxillus ammoniavirescens]|nr:hypothetical protein BDN67DRAFT_976397 [Paxillus ammoniavirescens]
MALRTGVTVPRMSIAGFSRLHLYFRKIEKDPLWLWNEQVEYAAQFAMFMTTTGFEKIYGLGGLCSRASGARLEMAGYHR